MPSSFYAHSLRNSCGVLLPTTEWEPLYTGDGGGHLERVARLAKEFAGAFGEEEWGHVAGLWHDVGKYSTEFQRYLGANQDGDIHYGELSGKVDHSTAGAQFAVSRFAELGHLLAYAIAGHHAGLPDWDVGQGQSGLKQRLNKRVCNWAEFAPESLKSIPPPKIPSLGKLGSREHERAAFRVAFWIRMLFSALVDADFLATEAFMSQDRSAERPRAWPSLSRLSETLESYVASLSRPDQKNDKPINQIRREVFATCLAKAASAPGFFSLCVPTGGGKTLASLAFALRHAERNNLRRVIIAVPFTSIIEQNAKIYRDIFHAMGREIVLEHHSNLDPKNETTTNRLQSENWDAPVVVTTNVQLFESLFASRTSRCRKLHRISGSVIVLDEAQALPVELLKPTLWAMRELVEVCGCSVVFCSATQPALSWRDDFPIGLPEVQPIIDDARSLHESLRRVEIERAGPLDDKSIATRLREQPQVLCVVNTRPHAAKVSGLLGEQEGSFHLSTRMCAAHRLKTLETIRKRLAKRLPCRVVSTQLIEAGVDVDFPVVYRASCGLDSLAQAAGRCNREGLLEVGKVVHFEAETPPPCGYLRQSADDAKELLGLHDDLLAPTAIESYFRLHYWKQSDKWDKHRVLETVGNQPSAMRFNFRQMAERYQFIRDETESILVGWGKTGQSLIAQLDSAQDPTRLLWRKLQRYSVQVRSHELLKLQEAGAIEPRHERWVLVQNHLYEDRLGLRLDKADGVLPIEDCIA